MDDRKIVIGFTATTDEEKAVVAAAAKMEIDKGQRRGKAEFLRQLALSHPDVKSHLAQNSPQKD